VRFVETEIESKNEPGKVNADLVAEVSAIYEGDEHDLSKNIKLIEDTLAMYKIMNDLLVPMIETPDDPFNQFAHMEE